MGISEVWDSGITSIGMEYSEVALALGELSMALRDEVWQKVSVVDKGSWLLSTALVTEDGEVIARIRFEKEGFLYVRAHIRTDLLAKYQEQFHAKLRGIVLTFDRLRPYLSSGSR
jgi:hypothetical protein